MQNSFLFATVFVTGKIIFCIATENVTEEFYFCTSKKYQNMDSKKSDTQKQPMDSNKKAKKPVKTIHMPRYRVKTTPQPPLSTMLEDGTIITHHK